MSLCRASHPPPRRPIAEFTLYLTSAGTSPTPPPASSGAGQLWSAAHAPSTSAPTAVTVRILAVNRDLRSL
eukprot:560901-Rhodomonas_salina.1